MSEKSKLTKKQKLTILNKVIELLEVQNPEYRTFCIIINKEHRKLIKGEFINVGIAHTFELIPELLKYKPEVLHQETLWFPINAEGLFNRIQVLKCTVEDIKKQK